MRCAKCSGINIQHLVELAQVEFEGCSVPSSSYYEHYRSIHDLELSAESGCDLCGLMIRAFDNTAPNPYEYPGEDSLLSVIKSWEEPALINVAIQASHVYASAGLDEVRNFDLLQIFATTREEIDPDDYDARSLDFATHLMLSTRRDHAIKLGEFTIGRYGTDADLSSDDNFAIAKDWLITCTTAHKECQLNNTAILPSRVIDVGDKNDEDCRIFINNGDISAQYAALSHCWGGQVDCVLKSTKLLEFQERLPWDELAANFQDAIIVTRKLGVKYLWIDSFCIVQDDYHDWAQQSTKMADIYRNAVVTIAAMSSPASGHGFIRHAADPPTFLDQAIEIPLSTKDQRTVTVSPFRQQDSYRREDMRLLDMQAPLSMRGWCLQEAVLSSRILFYGQSRIYWKCLQGYQSADGAHSGTLFPDSSYPTLTSILFSAVSLKGTLPVQPLDRAAVLGDYYALTNRFSHRKLTKLEDKLPAFSGLAGPVHLAVGGQYLAGLFSEYIRSGLLWSREMSFATHLVSYRAPSWSWADTDDPVIFPWDIIEFVDDASTFELLGSHIELKHEGNLYGEVTGGYLLVHGCTMELWRTRETMNATDMEWNDEGVQLSWDEAMIRGEPLDTRGRCIVEYMEDGAGRRGRIVEMVDADEPSEGLEYTPPKKYTALLLHKGIVGEIDREDNGLGLILERIETEDVNIYRRAGFFRLHPNEDLLDLQNWARERLKII